MKKTIRNSQRYVIVKIGRKVREMTKNNSMKSAFIYLIIGFALSLISIDIGIISDIQGYLSVWCYLLGLYLLRKENRFFSISFLMQIYLTLIFIISRVYPYVTPIELSSTFVWINFIIKSIQQLLIIYACHLLAPSMNVSITLLSLCAVIGIGVLFQGQEIDLLFGFVIFSLVMIIIYQLLKALKDVKNLEMKVSLQKIPIVKMIALFLASGFFVGVLGLYTMPYTAYHYTGDSETVKIDMPLIDTIELSDGWSGEIYNYSDEAQLYVIRCHKQLLQKTSFIDVELPTYSEGGAFSLSHITFGNGEKNYQFDEINNKNIDVLNTFSTYRVYLNPDDENFEMTVQFTNHDEEKRLGEVICSLTSYPYGKLYRNIGIREQGIFFIDNGKWRQ